jgi:hypothetical protein
MQGVANFAQSAGEQLCLGLANITPFTLRCFDPAGLRYVGYVAMVAAVFAMVWAGARLALR